MRLDELLVQRELCADLHDARASIMAGEVVVGEHRATSAGMRVTDDTALRLKEGKRRGGFVSRGGLKLQRALDAFAIDVTGLSCVDLGASSGGFTDCLLRSGTRKRRRRGCGTIRLGTAQRHAREPLRTHQHPQRDRR